MESIKNIVIYIVVLMVLWTAGTYFADNVSSYEVITPEPGVNCVVVSRMFNTSVSCWGNDNAL